MKQRYIVFTLLAIGIIVIHVDSLAFPHSVLLRHLILLVFIAFSAYYAYESRRKHLEELDKLKKYLKVCSMCKNVCIIAPDTQEDKWVTFEEYIALEHNFKSSHVMCPRCSELTKITRK